MKYYLEKQNPYFSWSIDFLRESNEVDDASSLVCDSIFSLFFRFFTDVDDELSDIDEIDFDTGVLILDLLEDYSYHSWIVWWKQTLTQQVENKAFQQH